MSIKLIASDIDGTLLSFKTHRMSPATLDALHTLKEKGIRLFLSTGRHKSMIREVRELFPFDGCITLNGRIDRKFFYDQFYGTRNEPNKEE